MREEKLGTWCLIKMERNLANVQMYSCTVRRYFHFISRAPPYNRMVNQLSHHPWTTALKFSDQNGSLCLPVVWELNNSDHQCSTNGITPSSAMYINAHNPQSICWIFHLWHNSFIHYVYKGTQPTINLLTLAQRANAQNVSFVFSSLWKFDPHQSVWYQVFMFSSCGHNIPLCLSQHILRNNNLILTKIGCFE